MGQNNKYKGKRILPYISLSYRCNLGCSYCYAKALIEKFPDITPEDFGKALDWISKDGFKDITLCGGEPTFHPEFEDILKVLKEKGCTAKLLTNGLFDENLIGKLEKSSVHTIVMNYNPFDYNKEQETMVNKNLKRISTSSLKKILRYNVHTPEIQDLYIDVYKKYNFDMLVICLTIPGTKGNNVYVSHDSFVRYAQSLVEYVDRCKKEKVKIFLEDSLPFCAFTKEQRLFLKKTSNFFSVCNTMNNFVINPDLTAFPCVALHIQTPNILSFKDIDHMQEYWRDMIRKLRWETPAFESCNNCIYHKRRRCQGPCLTHKLPEDLRRDVITSRCDKVQTH